MPTIGEQLKKARETRKLTIKQVVQAIHVRAPYLQAMESDDFSILPSPAQARGFLRIYAEFLRLNADDILEHHPGAHNVELTHRDTLPEPLLQQIMPAHNEKKIETVEIIPNIDPEISTSRPINPTPSQNIFLEIGKTIKYRRELISLTIEEVERHTHIRKQNLLLIEAGEFNQIPSPVQVKGMLGSFASFLDLDPEEILLKYAEGLQSSRIERQAPETAKKISGINRVSIFPNLFHFLTPDLIFGGSMVIIMLALSIWGAARIFSAAGFVESTPTQGPSISDVLLATQATDPAALVNVPTIFFEDGTAIPTNDESNPGPTATIAAAEPTNSSAVQITIVVLERTFLRVIVDGETKLEERVSPGAALSYDGNNRIEVLTGSGTAVHIIFNQSDLGAMGNFGEIANRIYTINGVETPTPTSTPTPTITPIPSRTLRPTLTPRPTSTPRPGSTLKPFPTIKP
ncbi:MAG: helix-turn-helix domain-containing protein [Chloroflexota bacterium]